MADGGDDLAGFDKGFDDSERLVVDPQLVGIHNAAGQNQRVVITDLHRIERKVDVHRRSPIILLPAVYLPSLGRCHFDLGAFGLQLFKRLHQLRLLETVRRHDEDAALVDGRHCLLPISAERDNGEPGRSVPADRASASRRILFQ
jgi:hypothetical protein